MDFVESIVSFLASAARAMWPGVLGAAAVGYIGYRMMGTPGFVVASGIGALAGTWVGARLGIKPIRPITGWRGNDQLLQALGAFLVVAFCYFLIQLAILIIALTVLMALAAFFMG